MKNIYITLFSLLCLTINAQVGVGTTLPKSTLDINGSIGYKIEEISANKTLGINDFYINYTGASIATITLPSDNNITGRIYYIKNSSSVNVSVIATNSQTIRVGFANGVTSYTITPGQTFKFVRSSNTTSNDWESSRTDNPIVATSRVVLYSSKLRVPPFGITTTNYPTYSINNWKLTQVVETTGDRVRGSSGGLTADGRATIGFKASKLDLTYEYQGVPFNVNKVFPLLTAGNDNTAGITLAPSSAKIENDPTSGKTILKVSVARTDLFGVQSGTDDANIQYISNWTDTNAFLNVLIATQIN
jgi:hypothetical protein